MSFLVKSFDTRRDKHVFRHVTILIVEATSNNCASTTFIVICIDSKVSYNLWLYLNMYIVRFINFFFSCKIQLMSWENQYYNMFFDFFVKITIYNRISHFFFLTILTKYFHISSNAFVIFSCIFFLLMLTRFCDIFRLSFSSFLFLFCQ